jgi:hypothetical protein
VSAAIDALDGGGSHVHITRERFPSNAKGRFAAVVIKMTRGAPISKSVKKVQDGLAEKQA